MAYSHIWPQMPQLSLHLGFPAPGRVRYLLQKNILHTLTQGRQTIYLKTDEFF